MAFLRDLFRYHSSMEKMEIEQSSSSVSGVTVFALKGPFTLATMINFQSSLRDPAMQGAIVDMSGVPYMDSAGLGLLLGQWSHSQRAGKKFALTGIAPRVHTIFTITHTDKLLPIFATVAEAEQALVL
jgi:anti-anti-sigma factor